MRGMHNSNLPSWWRSQLSKPSLLSCVPVLAGTMMIIGYAWQTPIEESKQRREEKRREEKRRREQAEREREYPFSIIPNHPAICPHSFPFFLSKSQYKTILHKKKKPKKKPTCQRCGPKEGN